MWRCIAYMRGDRKLTESDFVDTSQLAELAPTRSCSLQDDLSLFCEKATVVI